jgi:hypothetical protein
LIPDWLLMPSVQLIDPKNNVYSVANVTIAFVVNKQVAWLGYSLDGQNNVTISGNTTINNLPNGLHNITVYANDTFGNKGTSETVNFTIAVPESFPAVSVAVSIVVVAMILVVAGLLVYHKKHKPT